MTGRAAVASEGRLASALTTREHAWVSRERAERKRGRLAAPHRPHDANERALDLSDAPSELSI